MKLGQIASAVLLVAVCGCTVDNSTSGPTASGNSYSPAEDSVPAASSSDADQQPASSNSSEEETGNSSQPTPPPSSSTLSPQASPTETYDPAKAQAREQQEEHDKVMRSAAEERWNGVRGCIETMTPQVMRNFNVYASTIRTLPPDHREAVWSVINTTCIDPHRDVVRKYGILKDEQMTSQGRAWFESAYSTELARGR